MNHAYHYPYQESPTYCACGHKQGNHLSERDGDLGPVVLTICREYGDAGCPLKCTLYSADNLEWLMNHKPSD